MNNDNWSISYNASLSLFFSPTFCFLINCSINDRWTMKNCLWNCNFYGFCIESASVCVLIVNYFWFTCIIKLIIRLSAPQKWSVFVDFHIFFLTPFLTIDCDRDYFPMKFTVDLVSFIFFFFFCIFLQNCFPLATICVHLHLHHLLIFLLLWHFSPREFQVTGHVKFLLFWHERTDFRIFISFYFSSQVAVPRLCMGWRIGFGVRRTGRSTLPPGT